jgi:hypothetical protein
MPLESGGICEGLTQDLPALQVEKRVAVQVVLSPGFHADCDNRDKVDFELQVPPPSTRLCGERVRA